MFLHFNSILAWYNHLIYERHSLSSALVISPIEKKKWFDISSSNKTHPKKSKEKEFHPNLKSGYGG